MFLQTSDYSFLCVLSSLSIEPFLFLVKLLPWARKFLQTSEYSLIIISTSFLFSCPCYPDPFFILGLDLVLFGPSKLYVIRVLEITVFFFGFSWFPCTSGDRGDAFDVRCDFVDLLFHAALLCQGSSPWTQLRNCLWFYSSTQFFDFLLLILADPLAANR